MTMRASRSSQSSDGRSAIPRRELSCTTKGIYIVQDEELIIFRRRSLKVSYIEGVERSSFADRNLSCPTKGAYVVQDGRSYAA